MAKDYYKILGIEKNASQEEIKKAFRQLARKYHPDLNSGNKQSEDKFKEINEAYQVLSNTDKRNQYDQYGEATFRPEDFSNYRESFNFDDLFSDFGFGDIFNIFRERNGNQVYAEEGSDLRYDIEISLEDVFRGLKTNIEIPIYDICDRCKGNGAEPGFSKECDICGGTGQVRQTRKQGFMHFTSVNTCPKCHGSGSIIEKKCEKCQGNGRIKKIEKIKLEIPKGVEDGQYLRIVGKGEPGHNAPSGDLYVIIHVKKHDRFKRKGADIFVRYHINILTAISGGKVLIPGIDKQIKLKIPSGTQGHTKFRVKGYGLPYLKSYKRGDFFVRVIVDIPKNLSASEKKDIEKILKK